MQQNFYQPQVSSMNYYSSLDSEIKQELKKAVTYLNSQNFEVIQILGKGSFGIVVSAKNYILNTSYAVKIQSLMVFNENNNCIRLSSNDKNYQAKVDEKKKILENEGDLMKQANHENVVKYFNSFINDNIFYIVMEELETNLERQYQKMKGSMDNMSMMGIWKQMILGMEYLHSKKICLRDIKLENILISNEGVIKYCDFGLSKQITEYNMFNSSNSNVIGNLHSKPPEIIDVLFNQDIQDKKAYFKENNISQNEISDVWGLGIAMFQLAGVNSGNLFQYTIVAQPISSHLLTFEANQFILEILNRDRKKRPNISQVKIKYNNLIRSQGIQQDSQLLQNFIIQSKIQSVHNHILEENNQNQENINQINYQNHYHEYFNQQLKYPYELYINDELNLDYSIKQKKQVLKRILVKQKYPKDKIEVITAFSNQKLKYENFDKIAKVGGFNYSVVSASKEGDNQMKGTLYYRMVNEELISKIQNALCLLYEADSCYIIQSKQMAVIKVDNELHCIVECEGTSSSLKEYLKYNHDIRYTEQKKMDYAFQMISAVYALHNNMIIHRDIRFKHFFISDKQNKGDVEIKLSWVDSLTKLNYIDEKVEYYGCALYSSPECYENQKQSMKTDIWSLGVALIELDNQDQDQRFKFNLMHILRLKQPFTTFLEGVQIKRNTKLYKLASYCLKFNESERPTIKQLLDYFLEL